jgi:hypothetical protein
MPTCGVCDDRGITCAKLGANCPYGKNKGKK